MPFDPPLTSLLDVWYNIDPTARRVTRCSLANTRRASMARCYCFGATEPFKKEYIIGDCLAHADRESYLSAGI